MERGTAVAADVSLDLLVRDLQRQVDKSMVRKRRGCEGGELIAPYSVGVRVPHVEKVFGIGRVCLGLKDVLGASRTADTHGKSHAAHEDVHVVFRREKAAGANVSVCQASVGQYRTWDR